MKYSHLVLIVIIVIASIGIYQHVQDEKDVKYEESSAILQIHSSRLATIIDGTINVTKILEELVLLHNGTPPIDDVERLCKLLFDENIHMTLAYAPNGIIEYVYPFEGNEEAIGHKLLIDPVTRDDAQKAKETGIATLSKPYVLRQGRLAAVVRDPVYITRNGIEEFWGFIAIAMRTSQGLIMHSDIASLEQFNYKYKLSYCYNDEKVVILQSDMYDDTHDALSNIFNTKYGAWELLLYYESTNAETLKNMGINIVIFIAYAYMCLDILYHLKQKVQRKKT